MDAAAGKKLALIGAEGMLGSCLKKILPASTTLLALDLPGFDMTDRGQVRAVLDNFRPDLIINCAAYTDVDGCENEEQLATAVNGSGPGFLAEAALSSDATLVHISTDYVFSGEKGEPYTEADIAEPKSAYGRSKLAGESAIMRSGLKGFLIVRTSWLYGYGGNSFVDTIRRLASERKELRVVADQIGTPTYAGDLVQAIDNLLKTGTSGIYHFSNSGQCSWYEFACKIVANLRSTGQKLEVGNVLPINTEDYPLPAERPAYSVLSKQKYVAVTGATVPEWHEALAGYMLNNY